MRWRRAHTLNFLVWTLALVHGIAAGSDTDTRWTASLYVVCASSVAAATAWRVARATSAGAWVVGLTTCTAGVVCAELTLALALGPLGRGAA